MVLNVLSIKTSVHLRVLCGSNKDQMELYSTTEWQSLEYYQTSYPLKPLCTSVPSVV